MAGGDAVRERLWEIDAQRELAPLHERRGLDVAVRRGADVLRADERRLRLERRVRVRERAALAVVRIGVLRAAAEVLGLVQLIVPPAPLEQRRHREVSEER